MSSSHNKLPAAERLLPALLDRLSDDDPEHKGDVSDPRTMSKSQFRRCVLRDIGWLMNASNAESETDFASFPEARLSVVNFGLPALSGKRVSDMDWPVLEQNMRRAIIAFEPRILPDTLEVHARTLQEGLEHHNQVFFEIRGQLWCEPYPLELLLRSQLDLESGQVLVQDMAGAN